MNKQLVNSNENNNFDAALYWEGKPFKKYVCTLTDDSGVTHSTICSSSASDTAAEIAVRNSCLEGPVTCTDVRLATPTDLGATPTLPPTLKEKLHRFAHSNNLRKLTVTNHDHILVGNAPAITYVNTLKEQHTRLSAALADCLAIMAQCQQNHDYPKTFDSPIGTIAWDATVAAARLLLKEGNLPQFNQSNQGRV
ncbi:hypothetical protein J8L98_23140 [Pseudoalteromonas sp. MMG013]|uniref:hypothetical protein n=1 Tax=Pseudoalteromonas sp. MMG013 TaxID=2822687 RepID=UPI001B388323|nr:hypothetical protein [Pseudoalteromonas sp. MMG013]MBQ4864582.1 hypothetical protein [Pseudoalteromonas sp. MMG013]